MKVMVISLAIIIFSTSLLSAVEFSLNSINSVNLNEEFQASIDADISETYDVKIFATDDSGEITSLIYNDGWKNSYYYVKASFPEKKEYKIKITSGSKEQTLCARLRPSGKTSYDEVCTSIEVEEGSIEPDVNGNDEDNEETTKQDNKKSTKESKEKDQEENLTSTQSTQIIPNTLNSKPSEESQSANKELPYQGKIILNELNTDPIQIISQKEFFSSQKNKMLIWFAYAFAFFCLAIILFIFFRKI